MIKYRFIYSVALGILILVMVPLAAFGRRRSLSGTYHLASSMNPQALPSFG